MSSTRKNMILYNQELGNQNFSSYIENNMENYPQNRQKISIKGDRFIPNFCQQNFEIPVDYQQNYDSRPQNSSIKKKHSNYTNLLKQNIFNENKILSYSPKNEAKSQFDNLTKNLVKVQENKNKLRKISQNPIKTIDLKDDFYLNLLSWSQNNLIAIADGKSINIYNPLTDINKRITLPTKLDTQIQYFSSVQWAPLSNKLAIGQNTGSIYIYDTEHKQQINFHNFHSMRISSLYWKSYNTFLSGSRDCLIKLKDIRDSHKKPQLILKGHKNEISNIQCSYDEKYIASGGNDNSVFIWDIRYTHKYMHKIDNHKAAVKAVQWSPHQHNYLLTGGGNGCGQIYLWNLNNFQQINKVDTGAQVCNIYCSKKCSEFVSSHGYSTNSINVWDFKTFENIGNIQAHSNRVLYMAAHPSEEKIVTGSATDFLKIWDVFKQDQERDRHISIRNCLVDLR